MRKHYPLDPTTGTENAALLPWTDGDPSTGTDGSYPGNKLMTDQEAEILNAQAAAGLSASSSGDLTQLAQAMSIGLFVGVFGGTANALTAAIAGSVNIPTLQVGMIFHGIVGPSANTGAATLNLGGFATAPGVKPIVLKDGSTALSAGDLPANAIVSVRWDGTNFRHVGAAASDIRGIVPTSGGIISVIDTAGASTADSLVGTASPPITGYVQNQIFQFAKNAAANATTTPTGNVSGLGAKTFVRNDGSPLAAGDLPANETFLAVYVLGSNTFRVLNPAPSNVLSTAVGRLLRTSVYTNVAGTLMVSVNGGTPVAAGSPNFTHLPQTVLMRVAVIGGGGGGGGTGIQGSTTAGLASGGGGGAYGYGYYAPVNANIAVGAGGASSGNGANAGGAGGTSSFGVLITAPGGPGGLAGASYTAPAVIANSPGANPATGGNILNAPGGQGTPGATTAGGFYSGGGGASGAGYPGPPPAGSNSNGIDAVSPGAGGGGACSGASGPALHSGVGAAGLVIVEEYIL